MAYRTIWKDDGILWHYFGHVTADDISEANDEFFNDYRSRKSRYQIIDASGIEVLEWQQDDIVETSANDVGASMAVQGLKIAFVVSEDEDVLEKIHAYIELCKQMDASWTFNIFRDLSEAEEWVKK